MIPPKKKGLDVMIAVGKPKGDMPDDPRPPKMDGAPGADDDMPDDAPEPDGDEQAEDPGECMKRIESKLDQIIDAMGLNDHQMPPEDMGGGGAPMPPPMGQ